MFEWFWGEKPKTPTIKERKEKERRIISDIEKEIDRVQGKGLPQTKTKTGTRPEEKLKKNTNTIGR